MLRRWIDRLRGRVPELRALSRRPILFLYLKRVRASVIAMVAHIAFMSFLLEPLLRWLIPPPERPSGLLAIFSGPPPPPPHLEVLRWLDPILWVIGWAAFCVFLERSIQPALARAREKSRELEARAQEHLARGEVVAGLTLLADAAAVAPDEPERARIRATLVHVEQTLVPAAARGAPAGGASGATVAFDAAAAGVLADASEPTAPPVKTMAGGRITIDGPIGAGAMGRVFAATDQLLGRRVAIKELVEGIAENPEHRERFLREARVLARMSHPNVVQVFDLLREGGRSYLCMELVEGASLERELERRGSIPVREAARIGAQIASALAYAHGRGIVHRDLKPANVLFTAEGTVKVVDFGVARLLDTKMTRTGMWIGTPAYMSPEQIRGEDADARSDLYALGVLLYELVAGRPPFDGNFASLLTRHLTEPAPRLAVDEEDAAARAFADRVAELLSKDPSERPHSAAEVAERLLAIAGAPEAARAASSG